MDPSPFSLRSPYPCWKALLISLRSRAKLPQAGSKTLLMSAASVLLFREVRSSLLNVQKEILMAQGSPGV